MEDRLEFQRHYSYESGYNQWRHKMNPENWALALADRFQRVLLHQHWNFFPLHNIDKLGKNSSSYSKKVPK